MERLDELLQQELSRLIGQETETLGIVSVLGVQTARDLSQAHIYIQSLDREPAEILATLRQRARSYRMLLGQRLSLRRLPELLFHADTEAAGQAERVEALLEEIARERH